MTDTQIAVTLRGMRTVTDQDKADLIRADTLRNEGRALRSRVLARIRNRALRERKRMADNTPGTNPIWQQLLDTIDDSASATQEDEE